MFLTSAVAVACSSDSPTNPVQIPSAGTGGTAPSAGAGTGGQTAGSAGTGGSDTLGGTGGTPATGGSAGATTGGGGGSPVAGGGASGLPVIKCDTIAFKDPGLEAAVRAALMVVSGTIPPTDAQKLAALDATDRNIADLSGIECLIAVQSLKLGGKATPNKVADLTPVRYLTRLKTLDVSNNPVADLTPVASLRQLSDLSLNGNMVPDLAPLADLGFDLLHIENATLKVPASLAMLTNLRGLDAVGTIDDAMAVSTLHLSHLELGQVTLKNVDSLTMIGNLNYLDVIKTGLTSADTFATLTELTHLSLQDNAVTDVHPLQNLTGLSELSLSGTAVTSVAPLVLNQGLSNGDKVDLTKAPLDCPTEAANVKALSDRGVMIIGNPCP